MGFASETGLGAIFLSWEGWQDAIGGSSFTGRSRRFLYIPFCMIGGYCKNRQQPHSHLSYSYTPPAIVRIYIITSAHTYSNQESLTVTGPT